jgi:hypothetical protein
VHRTRDAVQPHAVPAWLGHAVRLAVCTCRDDHPRVLEPTNEAASLVSTNRDSGPVGEPLDEALDERKPVVDTEGAANREQVFQQRERHRTLRVVQGVPLEICEVDGRPPSGTDELEDGFCGVRAVVG